MDSKIRTTSRERSDGLNAEQGPLATRTFSCSPGTLPVFFGPGSACSMGEGRRTGQPAEFFVRGGLAAFAMAAREWPALAGGGFLPRGDVATFPNRGDVSALVFLAAILFSRSRTPIRVSRTVGPVANPMKSASEHESGSVLGPFAAEPGCRAYFAVLGKKRPYRHGPERPPTRGSDRRGFAHRAELGEAGGVRRRRVSGGSPRGKEVVASRPIRDRRGLLSVFSSSSAGNRGWRRSFTGVLEALQAHGRTAGGNGNQG